MWISENQDVQNVIYLYVMKAVHRLKDMKTWSVNFLQNPKTIFPLGTIEYYITNLYYKSLFIEPATMSTKFQRFPMMQS